MSDNGITSIVFLPVCTKCLNIIWQEIDGQQSVGDIYGSPRLLGAKYDISPDKCPNCGKFINSVVIPTKLPFNSSEYMEDR